MRSYEDNTLKPIGYALSDTVGEHRRLKKTLEELKPEMIELQLDDFVWDFDEAYEELQKVGFISVHSAAKGIDISSEDVRTMDYSLRRTLRSMDIAKELGADILVMHPVNDMYLDPVQRLRAKDRFRDMFSGTITNYHKDNGHEYTICLENIEYPKYPATFEEAEGLLEDVAKNGMVKLAIDIPHVWNIRRILREDPERYRPLTNGFPDDERLDGHIRRFIERRRENIGIYHIAGFGEDPVRTHDLIYRDSINSEYIELIDELRKKPLLMEIHDQSLESFKYSKRVLEELSR